MESSIAAFLLRQSACELLATSEMQFSCLWLRLACRVSGAAADTGLNHAQSTNTRNIIAARAATVRRWSAASLRKGQ